MPAHSSDELVPTRRTFLFTDIEGSYRQWERHPEAMPRALAAHDALLKHAVSENGGRIFKTVGDAVCAVFETPRDGVRAAVEAQRALSGTPWQEIGLAQPLTVRMALQSGDAEERDGDFAGLVLNRISRLLRAGHGGQVLISPFVAAAVQQSPLPGVGLRDLGERRLRDVPGANHIYQLEIEGLRSSFPPLETLDAIAHNLPVALNACLDREAELIEIRRLLLDSPARLVTLLGPGGIGKTRLALHAALQLIDAYAGGIWFVDLSGVRDPGLIPGAVVSLLGGRIEPGNDPIATIADQAGERNLLLILDNCEQIVDDVASFVAELLPRATGVRVLATSRVPLRIRGEQRVDVGPLPVEAGALAGPAVQLFLERAQQIRPAFDLTDANRDSIFEICHRVDGIPLALELAAARVAVLSPEALRNRLSSRLSLLTSTSRDLPERHQTLRAAIAWSYGLLAEDEQRVFRTLSVFQGGWSFAGAQAVLGLDELATMEVLASLRDKSLVRLAETDDGESRYSMLETIQEFGFEQLSERNQQQPAQAAHATFYAALLDEAANYIESGPLQRHWLHALDRDVSNIRLALQWSLDVSDTELALDLCINSWGYWSQRGLAGEGQGWFHDAFTQAGEIAPSLRAGAYRRLGNLSVERGELRMAESLYRASLEIERAQQDLPGLASSLLNLGMVTGMLGRMPDEYEFQIEALSIFRQIGDIHGAALSLYNLAFWARNYGDCAEARRMLDEVGELQIQLQDEIGVAFRHTLLARLAIDQGDTEVAATYLDSAEPLFTLDQIEDGYLFVWLLRAEIESNLGNAALAHELIEKALEGYQSRGDKAFEAQAYELHAAICAQLGNAARGAESIGSAQQLRELTGAAIAPVDMPARERDRAGIEHALGTQLFAIHCERGRLRHARAARSSNDLMELINATKVV